jgi:hypothetical protein
MHRGFEMKSFKDYLTEGKKTYAFKVKVAGELPEKFSENLKTCMERFSVIKVSNGKRTPISETPLDFPNLSNKEVTIFEVEVNYPTTPQVLHAYISQLCGVREECVKVRTGNEPSEMYQEEMGEKKEEYKPLIGQCDYEEENNQNLVGEQGKMTLLKDLLKTKNAGEQYKGVNDAILANKAPTGDKQEEMPEGGKTSPIGSKGR